MADSNKRTWPRCRVVPLPDFQTVFLVDEKERLRWHFNKLYPKPFFFPLIGPSGKSLTRMGHPGAPDHDHHRSVWFAHANVAGFDFWSEKPVSGRAGSSKAPQRKKTTSASPSFSDSSGSDFASSFAAAVEPLLHVSSPRIFQDQWLTYEDGEQAVMAVRLIWTSALNAAPLLEQELITVLRPLERGELVLELQSRFTPFQKKVVFGKTHFGFLAVRVAKYISEHFGGGVLRNSEGAVHEANVFGKKAKWVDYSGHVAAGVVEGITYVDHPSNPGFPSRWHVRMDGWMTASPCYDRVLVVEKERPLMLRYLLHVHAGPLVSETADRLATEFAHSPPLTVLKSSTAHQQYTVVRTGD